MAKSCLFPVTVRGKPLCISKRDVVRWRGENWRVIGVTSSNVGAGSRRYADFLDVKNARGVRELIPADTFKHGGATVKKRRSG